jgi:hypothetical protein
MTEHAQKIAEHLSKSYWDVVEEYDGEYIQNVIHATPPGGSTVTIFPVSPHVTAFSMHCFLIKKPLTPLSFVKRAAERVTISTLIPMWNDGNLYTFDVRAVYCGPFDDEAFSEFLRCFLEDHASLSSIPYEDMAK